MWDNFRSALQDFFASSWGEKLDTLDLQGAAKGFCTSILLDLFLTV